MVHILELKDSQFVYRINDLLTDANKQAIKPNAPGWDKQLTDFDGIVRVCNIVAWPRNLFLTDRKSTRLNSSHWE